MVRSRPGAGAALLLAGALVLGPVAAFAQVAAPAPPVAAVRFDSIEAMIPMRDGIRLRTRIFTPKAATTPLPFLLTRTPYGISGASGSFAGSYAELAREGFIFAFQDIRGRFGSEGSFVMLRPPRDQRDPKAVDESTDTHDTIEWLLKNLPRHNGRVGMLGVSYPGWLTVMAMLDPHPALKAVSPQASPASMYLGDDFHHNGAFRLAYGFEYVALMEASKELSPFSFDQFDSYSWYLSLGPLSNADAKHFQGKYPTWNNFVAHPDYDAFWQREAVMQYLDRVRVPTLNVAGWWDQEDFYGPLKIYETLERHDTGNLNSTTWSWVPGTTADGAGGAGRSWAGSTSATPPRCTSSGISRCPGSPGGSRTRAPCSWPKPPPLRRAPTRGAPMSAGRPRPTCHRAGFTSTPEAGWRSSPPPPRRPTADSMPTCRIRPARFPIGPVPSSRSMAAAPPGPPGSWTTSGSPRTGPT
jgi:hypothetical protein